MQPERPHFSSGAAMIISFLMMIVSVLLTVPKFVTATVSSVFHLISYDSLCYVIKITKYEHDNKMHNIIYSNIFSGHEFRGCSEVLNCNM
jgi:hypothetical protein